MELQAGFSRQIKHRKQDCEENHRLPHFSGLNRTQLPGSSANKKLAS